jgi:hypothetical protein
MTTMKESRSTPLDDIRKALGDPFTMSESDVDDFLTRYDSNEIDVPPLPAHLLPAPLSRINENPESSESQEE